LIIDLRIHTMRFELTTFNNDDDGDDDDDDFGSSGEDEMIMPRGRRK